MDKMNETKTNIDANLNPTTNSSGQSQYRATRIVSKCDIHKYIYILLI